MPARAKQKRAIGTIVDLFLRLIDSRSAYDTLQEFNDWLTINGPWRVVGCSPDYGKPKSTAAFARPGRPKYLLKIF